MKRTRAKVMYCDRRTSVRIPSVGDRRATLLIGREECLVQIIDESTGGYGVLLSNSIALKVDAEAVLRLGEIAQVVRIAHVRMAGVHTRVGLEILRREDATAVTKLRRRRIRVAAFAFAALFVGLVIDHLLYRCGF
jgi:hypothetical protein